MKEQNFNELEWHDAIIKNIIIDRSNPGNMDIIEMLITWPSEKESKIIFRDVYHANLSLGFGIIGDDTIKDACLIDNSDKDIVAIKKVWERHYEGINKIKGFEILTNSTVSTIRIFSLSFSILEIS